jgi:DNA repair protein RadC
MYEKVTITTMTVREEADGNRYRSPEEIHSLCKDLGVKAQEHFMVLTFDTKNCLIDRHLVSLGTMSSTLVHPREVFRPAIADNAAQVIVVHNHPSGDPSPSSQDIRITKKLIEAGDILEIPIIDHVIIGRKNNQRSYEFISLRETGLCEFKGQV